MRAAIGAAILAAWFAVASSAAQEPAPNPVMERYRAYRAALDAGDRERAEQEAAQALAASEARDGDGGRTAVLALNLASIRFMLRRHSDALAPAQRAHALVQARGADAGIDPTLAELVLGRIELVTAPEAGEARLLTALRSASPQTEQIAELYLAAIDLGVSAQQRQRYAAAREAWNFAARFAQGSSLGAAYAEAHARVGAGSALFLSEVGSGRGRVSREAGEEAHAAFLAARRILQPIVMTPLPNGELTLPQRLYAEAVGWDGALIAKMMSDGQIRPNDRETPPFPEIGAPANANPPCPLRYYPPLNLEYPRDAAYAAQVGAAVMMLQVDANGRVAESRVITQVGSADFTTPLREARNPWRVRRRDNAPDNCRMEMIVIVPMRFAMIDYDVVDLYD